MRWYEAMLRAFFLSILTMAEDLIQTEKTDAQAVEPEVAVFSPVCGEGETIMDLHCMDNATMNLQAQQAAAILYLQQAGCTGWIVKQPTDNQGALVLTAGHCGQFEVEKFWFIDNHLCGDGRNGSGRLRATTCNGTRKAQDSVFDEYAIYELGKDCHPAETVTPIMLDVGMPEEGEGIYVLSHPNWWQKQVTLEAVHDEGLHCVLRESKKEHKWGFFWRRTSTGLTYFCDTQGGNVGGPVISTRTGFAVAVHTSRGCSVLDPSTANVGSWLGNSKSIFHQFQIPFFDRGQNNAVTVFEFLAKEHLPAGAKFDVLPGKTKQQCERTCANALMCMGFKYSALKSECSITYSVDQGLNHSSNQSAAAMVDQGSPSDVIFYGRTSSALPAKAFASACSRISAAVLGVIAIASFNHRDSA